MESASGAVGEYPRRALFQLVYLSAAVAPFSPEELEELLRVSRRNNARDGVTGMLLYEAGSFFQVLEGEKGKVRDVFERISKDARHQRVVVLSERDIPAREFAGWTMGFVVLDERKRELPGYVDFFGGRSDQAPARLRGAAELMLTAFREGRFRSYVR